MNTDITRVPFSEDAYWGPKNRFEVLDERFLVTPLETLFDWNEFPAKESEAVKVRTFLRNLGIKWVTGVEFTRMR